MSTTPTQSIAVPEPGLTQEEISAVTQISRKTIGKKLQGIRELLGTLSDGGPQ